MYFPCKRYMYPSSIYHQSGKLNITHWTRYITGIVCLGLWTAFAAYTLTTDEILIIWFYPITDNTSCLIIASYTLYAVSRPWKRFIAIQFVHNSLIIPQFILQENIFRSEKLKLHIILQGVIRYFPLVDFTPAQWPHRYYSRHYHASQLEHNLLLSHSERFYT